MSVDVKMRYIRVSALRRLPSGASSGSDAMHLFLFYEKLYAHAYIHCIV